jgi:hypothetical protein
MAQKPTETSYDVIYKELIKIREVSKKLTRVPKIGCYSSRKWPETDVFLEVIKSVRGGGTVRVTKCVILSSGMDDSNSRLERQ